jgi:hypothetical protein
MAGTQFCPLIHLRTTCASTTDVPDTIRQGGQKGISLIDITNQLGVSGDRVIDGLDTESALDRDVTQLILEDSHKGMQHFYNVATKPVQLANVTTLNQTPPNRFRKNQCALW